MWPRAGCLLVSLKHRAAGVTAPGLGSESGQCGVCMLAMPFTTLVTNGKNSDFPSVLTW